MAEDDDFVRITLRLPASLHARLTESAAKKKSMNAEIIDRLEYTFSDRDDYVSSFKEYVEENMSSMKEAILKSIAIVELDREERAVRDKAIQEALSVMRSSLPTSDAEREDQNAKLRAGLQAVEDEKSANIKRNQDLDRAFAPPDFEAMPSRKRMVEFEKKHGHD